MLKSVDPAVTADLLWALAAMGHGDTIAIVDANYPAHALHSRVITLAGVDMETATTAIASLLPIDRAVAPAVWGMVPDDAHPEPIESHATVAAVLSAAEGLVLDVAPLKRTAFYSQAKTAFAVVLTGETSSYACFLATKGVVIHPTSKD